MNTVRDMAVAYLLGDNLKDDTNGLKDYAKDLGVHVGAAINYWHIQGDSADQKYVAAIQKEYDILTAESTCKMKPIAKSWDNFDYSKCDYVLNWAEKNNIIFRGHATLWAKDPFYPDFIWSGDSQKLEDFAKKYIKTTVGRYKGRVWAWDVVNEAIDDKSPYKIRTNTPWGKINGGMEDFICNSFKWAHQADPNAELFYNDYGHSSRDGGWYGGRGDAIYNMIKNLKNKGCPIHGVGFQLHEDIDFGPKTFHIGENLDRYHNLGIKVHFTEVDVKGIGAWNSEKLQKQTQIYYQLLNVCLSHPSCESFETWGVSDNLSWLKEPLNPLPFDKDMRKKDAYYTMRDLLKTFPRNHAAVIERKQRQAEEQKKRLAQPVVEEETVINQEQVQEFLQ